MEKTNRELALEWWASFNEPDKVEEFMEYKFSNFTPANNYTELTGREIESIYNKFPRFNEPQQTDLNIGDIINNEFGKVYHISESDLSKLFTKINDEIYNVLNTQGRNCKISHITNAVNETIKKSLY